MDLVNNIDFWTISNRFKAYTQLPVQVTAVPLPGIDTTSVFVNHLLDTKLAHADKEIRRLAASAIALLASVETVDGLVTRLSEGALDGKDVLKRHGSLLTLTELVKLRTRREDWPQGERGLTSRFLSGRVMTVSFGSLLCSFDPINKDGQVCWCPSKVSAGRNRQ